MGGEGIESMERGFEGRSLEILGLFCRSGSFDGKMNGSLERQLALTNSLGIGWKLGENCALRA